MKHTRLKAPHQHLVVREDGETAHNASFDRDSKE
jgi:hypothetical protein